MEPVLDPILLDNLREWEDIDRTEESDAFDFIDHLPLIHAACMTMSRWTYFECMRTWTMFLISICMFARASCITTYCPTMEDIRMPREGGAEWDVDGMPDWIELGMRNWKHRCVG